MKQAIFITGFNNWGKTTIIQELFNGQSRFYQGHYYLITGVNAEFTVETHSNDDYQGQVWNEKVQERVNNESKKDLNLFTALCPSMENWNNFVDLLSNAPFTSYDKLHVFLIEYKWEHHSKLIIDNIINEGSKLHNVNFTIINSDKNQITEQTRRTAKINNIRQELLRIFP